MKRISALILLALACASCAVTLRTGLAGDEAGRLVLTGDGLFSCAGGACRRLGKPDGIPALPAAIHRAGKGETWVTYAPAAAAGATRMVPPPARTFLPSDGLRDGRISRVVSPVPGTHCFSYDRLLPLGISVLSGTVWTHLTSENSLLRDGQVEDLQVDARGGVWVRMYGTRSGVAALRDGKVAPFDTGNSALPRNAVDMIVPEPPGRGTPGDNVWFVTADGLTRHSLGDGAWKHFGRNPMEVTDLMRILGIDSLFAKEIVGIRDVSCGATSILLATPRRIYRYDGNSFTHLEAPFTEGLGDGRFAGVEEAGDRIWTALTSVRSKKFVELAVYETGRGWRRYNMRPFQLPEPDALELCPAGAEVWALAGEWGSRVVVLPPAGEPSVRNLAAP